MAIFTLNFLPSLVFAEKPTQDFYYKGLYPRPVHALINDSYKRPSSAIPTQTKSPGSKPKTLSCTGKYPKKIAATCFRNDPCSDRKGSKYKLKGLTCDRTKGMKGPLTYSAPHKTAESICPTGTTNVGGICYKSCPNNYSFNKGSRLCQIQNYGKCTGNKPKKIGARCYASCKTGFKTSGLIGQCDNVLNGKCKKGLDQVGALCYEGCKNGYEPGGIECVSKRPPKYVECGLIGYAKSKVACGFVTADVIFVPIALASAFVPETAVAEGEEILAKMAAKLGSKADELFALVKEEKFAKSIEKMVTEGGEAFEKMMTDMGKMMSKDSSAVKNLRDTDFFKAIVKLPESNPYTFEEMKKIGGFQGELASGIFEFKESMGTDEAMEIFRNICLGLTLAFAGAEIFFSLDPATLVFSQELAKFSAVFNAPASLAYTVYGVK